MKFVSLPTLNRLRFEEDPRPLPMLQRWCRKGWCQAKKMPDENGDWYVDLDEFDRLYGEPTAELDPKAQAILDRTLAKLGHAGA